MIGESLGPVCYTFIYLVIIQFVLMGNLQLSVLNISISSSSFQAHILILTFVIRGLICAYPATISFSSAYLFLFCFGLAWFGFGFYFLTGESSGTIFPNAVSSAEVP